MSFLLPQYGRQATLDRAAAGRSRAARQPPNDPAIRPPRTARITAASTASSVTGAVRCSVTVGTALAAACVKPPRNPPAPPVPPVPPVPPAPPKPPPPPPVNARAPPGVAEPVVLPPREAVSGCAKWPTAAAPRQPSPTPMAPPTMPIATDWALTWKTTRRLSQPSALSVPNSRMRRDTADMVSRLASRNAAIRTAIASHLPRLLARDDALEMEPVTWLASVFWSVMVTPGTDLVIAFATEVMSLPLVADT